MKHIRLFRLATLLASFFVIHNGYTQPGAVKPSDNMRITGSTPCGKTIQAILKIPADAKCDFIRWNLELSPQGRKMDAFTVRLAYGESQPNTNGFWGGGTKLEFEGTYHTVPFSSGSRRGKSIRLQSSSLQSDIYLLQMDDRIFHFLDDAKNLMVGNGGWSFTLNKVD